MSTMTQLDELAKKAAWTRVDALTDTSLELQISRRSDSDKQIHRWNDSISETNNGHCPEDPLFRLCGIFWNDRIDPWCRPWTLPSRPDLYLSQRDILEKRHPWNQRKTSASRPDFDFDQHDILEQQHPWKQRRTSPSSLHCGYHGTGTTASLTPTIQQQWRPWHQPWTLPSRPDSSQHNNIITTTEYLRPAMGSVSKTGFRPTMGFALKTGFKPAWDWNDIIPETKKRLELKDWTGISTALERRHPREQLSWN